MSLEEYESDLTELSSDEDATPVRSKSKKPARKTVKEKEYEIVSVLKAPRQTNYSTKHLFDMMEQDAVDLNPPYQRDVVWSEEKQVALIGSIFLNVAIPPIMLNTEQIRKGGGGEQRTCMDGKQRLTSIRRFLKGEIYFKHPDLGKRLWYNRPPRSTRAVLSTQQRQLFELKQIACIEYDSLTEAQQREIFQRVQNGVALTPAERLRAISGPRADLVREIMRQVPGIKRLLQSFEWGKGGDFHSLAFSVYLCHTWPLIKVVAIPQLEKWLQEAHSTTHDFQTGVIETFQIVNVIATHSDFKGCLDKIQQIPFTFVAVLIHLYKTRLSLGQLASAATGLRRTLVRDDIRATQKTIKALSQYIKDLPTQHLEGDDRDKALAVDGVRAYMRSSSHEVPAGSKPLKASIKRKREDVDTDDSDDKPIIKSRPLGRTRAKSDHPSFTLPQSIKKPPARIVSTPAIASIKPERPPVKKTPISSMPKIGKKSACEEPASPASTRVKRKSTQPAVVPNLHLEPTPPLKYVIPASLPEIEHAPTATPSRALPVQSEVPVSRTQEGDPGASGSPPSSGPKEDRLKGLREAKAYAATHFQTTPTYSGGTSALPTPTSPEFMGGPVESGSVPIPRGATTDPRRRPCTVGSPAQQIGQGLAIDPRLAARPPAARCGSHNSSTNSPATPYHPSPLGNMPHSAAGSASGRWSPQSHNVTFTPEQPLPPQAFSPPMAFPPSLSRATSSSFRGGTQHRF